MNSEIIELENSLQRTLMIGKFTVEEERKKERKPKMHILK